MWGTNSISQRYQSNNKLIFDGNKNNPINNSYYNNNTSEINLLYQTPIKQFENIPNNNNNINITPFRFDFNHYFGNLWSSGKIPNNNVLQQQIILSPSQMNKDNIPFYKKSLEKSYKLSPISHSNSQNNSISNSNNNNILLNQNNKINEFYEMNKNSNINTNNVMNDLGKKNLNQLFDKAKNDKFLYDENKKKLNNIKNNAYNNKINIKNKNYNLQISRQFIYSSPCACTMNINKPKKLFECSGGSTLATNSYNSRIINKNKRFRKNNDQITILKKFYDEHKHWTKNQIKEISQKIGLKENKVYKWLWDQRNKEIKATKFIVKKDNNNK